MKKLLLLTVALLVATPALAKVAKIDPVGCYAILFEKKYLDRHPQQQVESIRFQVKKAPKKSNWDWAFKFDLILKGKKYPMTMVGGCDLTRDAEKGGPTSLRCYTDPQPPDGGRVIFTPHGASSMLYLGTDPLVFGKQTVTFKKWDEQIQLEELDDWVCE